MLWKVLNSGPRVCVVDSPQTHCYILMQGLTPVMTPVTLHGSEVEVRDGDILIDYNKSIPPYSFIVGLLS
jgi:hypothetical protein